MRRRLQPAGGGRARADLVEPLEGLQEHGLRRVFRVGGVPEQPDRGREHHVLIPPHERLERMRGVHLGEEPRGRAKVSGGTVKYWDGQTYQFRPRWGRCWRAGAAAASPSPTPAGPLRLTALQLPGFIVNGEPFTGFAVQVENISQTVVDLTFPSSCQILPAFLTAHRPGGHARRRRDRLCHRHHERRRSAPTSRCRGSSPSRPATLRRAGLRASARGLHVRRPTGRHAVPADSPIRCAFSLR